LNGIDGGSDSSTVVNDLMKAQRKMFATLTTSSSSPLSTITTTKGTIPTTISNDDHNHHNISHHIKLMIQIDRNHLSSVEDQAHTVEQEEEMLISS